MKKFMSTAATFLLVLLSYVSPAAADDIRLGIPGYGGNGCPAGSASVTLSPDSKSLSILFDSYVAESGRLARKTLDRKTCNIAIPVHVPQGFSVSVFKVDYRGFADIPFNAQGTFNVEYFFAGIAGPKFTKTFTGGTSKDYLLSNDIPVTALVWSRCGEDVNLRVNTSAVSKSNSAGDTTLLTVDSADINAGIIYHLQWRRC